MANPERPHSALGERDIAPDPFTQFSRWFNDAASVPDANAMTLATATRTGKVSARVVLLKGFDERGFSFFTNYESRKGRELTENPHAALVFYWQPLGRQVRIEGIVTRMSEEESDAYFRTRPVGSQLGALASPQSQPIPNREFLETRYNEVAERFTHDPVPRPKHWGGYRLAPHAVEFWQSRENRLHDRILYTKTESDRWQVVRLAP